MDLDKPPSGFIRVNISVSFVGINFISLKKATPLMGAVACEVIFWLNQLRIYAKFMKPVNKVKEWINFKLENISNFVLAES